MRARKIGCERTGDRVRGPETLAPALLLRGAVDGPALAAAFALGLLLLAFPTYAVQKAVSLTSPAAVGAATALIPAVVFGLQIIEGRVAFSAATLAGLVVYALGALLVASAAFRDRKSVL